MDHFKSFQIERYGNYLAPDGHTLIPAEDTNHKVDDDQDFQEEFENGMRDQVRFAEEVNQYHEQFLL